MNVHKNSLKTFTVFAQQLSQMFFRINEYSPNSWSQVMWCFVLLSDQTDRDKMEKFDCFSLLGVPVLTQFDDWHFYVNCKPDPVLGQITMAGQRRWGDRGGEKSLIWCQGRRDSSQASTEASQNLQINWNMPGIDWCEPAGSGDQ